LDFGFGTRVPFWLSIGDNSIFGEFGLWNGDRLRKARKSESAKGAGRTGEVAAAPWPRCALGRQTGMSVLLIHGNKGWTLGAVNELLRGGICFQTTIDARAGGLQANSQGNSGIVSLGRGVVLGDFLRISGGNSMVFGS
jgi:hypothetical protein